MKFISILSLLFIGFSSYAQITITGTVYNKREPVYGASVSELGTKNGVFIFDGTFSLTVASKESIIEFSMIGYETQTRKVENDTVFNITLIQEAYNMGPVIMRSSHRLDLAQQSNNLSSISYNLYNYQRVYINPTILVNTDFFNNTEYDINLGHRIRIKKYEGYKPPIYVSYGYRCVNLPIYKLSQNMAYIQYLLYNYQLPINLSAKLRVGINNDNGNASVGGSIKTSFYYRLFKQQQEIVFKYSKWGALQAYKTMYASEILRSDFRISFGYEYFARTNVFSLGMTYSFNKVN